MNSANNDVYNRITQKGKVSFISVTLVNIGATTALSQFIIGATLGHRMTFFDAMISTTLGSLILLFFGFFLGFSGMKEGLSTSFLSRYCGFGRLGSVLIGLLITLSLLGWFGIQNSILAEGLSFALTNKISFKWIALFSGMSLTVLVALGFKSLDWIAKVSVPLFFFVIGWIVFIMLEDNKIFNLFFSCPIGSKITIYEGISIVVGGFIVGVITIPDISRYCKNSKHVFWMVALSLIVGEFIVNAITILLSHLLNTDDVVTLMTQSAGLLGLMSIILSAIKVNDTNLYSLSLGLSNILQVMTGKKWDYFKLTICIGTIGTLFSVLGILNHFVDFLSMLGVFFPPIAGVMLVDYYILKTSRKILDETREQGILPSDSDTPLIGWSAIVACIVGTLIGVFLNFGIPSLNSILVAGITYWLLMKLNKKMALLNK